MSISLKRVKFPLIVLTVQVIFILIFIVSGDYDETGDPTAHDRKSPIPKLYPMFQDVHVMIFVGFGFLYTFLQRYGFSGIGFNILLGAIAVQWSIIIRGLFFGDLTKGGKIKFSVEEMIVGDFNAATVLISFGALIGKTGPVQLVVMVLLEVIFANLGEYIGVHFMKISDIGGSMIVHAFGAYFGMAVSRVLYNEQQEKSTKLAGGYKSDIFALIGTIFLWCFWPSFNGGLAEHDERVRAVINTYASLMACVVVTMAVSSLVNKNGRIEISHLQNASLAGGVAVGTCANMPIQPWGALFLGAFAAIISTIGYKYITDFLCSKCKIHDPAGVNNLHGMPGVLAAIAGAVVAALASENNFGHSLYEIFPERAPPFNTTAYDEMLLRNYTAAPASGRSAVLQGGYQFGHLIITLLISIIGGIITGFVMKIPIWDVPNDDEMYDDNHYFITPEVGFPRPRDADMTLQIGLLNGKEDEQKLE